MLSIFVMELSACHWEMVVNLQLPRAGKTMLAVGARLPLPMLPMLLGPGLLRPELMVALQQMPQGLLKVLS